MTYSLLSRLGRVMIFLCFAASMGIGQDRFQLVSEMRTGYGGSAPVHTFAAYRYDTDGNRIDKRVFGGIDSTAAQMSSIGYTYDAQMRCIREVLFDANGDTLSMVQNGYGPDGLQSVHTLNKAGSVRFCDSLQYTGGVLVEQRRYSALEQMTFFHRYRYADGLIAADSLYESDGMGGFLATRALIFSRNADSTVVNEATWQLSSGQWYHISTTLMNYSNKVLVSASTYEGDATTRRLIDSLAYIVDANGNRTLEAHFDDERTKTYDISYIWRDLQSVAIVTTTDNCHLIPQFKLCNRHIEFGSPVSGSFELYRINGNRIYERRLARETFASLPKGMSAGKYVAMVRGTVNQSILVLINQ